MVKLMRPSGSVVGLNFSRHIPRHWREMRIPRMASCGSDGMLTLRQNGVSTLGCSSNTAARIFCEMAFAAEKSASGLWSVSDNPIEGMP